MAQFTRSRGLGIQIFRVVIAASVLQISLFSSLTAFARQGKNQGEFSKFAGDSPSKALPYATDVSPAMTTQDVAAALRKVADWQLSRSEAHFNRDWTFNVLYAGFMEVPEAVSGKKYRDAMRAMGKNFKWNLNATDFSNRDFANDQALAQTYLKLYQLDHLPEMMRPTQVHMDQMLQQVNPSDRLVWWWCDALFMAPSTLARLSQITQEKKYLDYMDREWWRTSDALYDQKRHLFYRDARFLDRREPNGQPIFWARGNGWVLAGLARVLQAMPDDYPTRPRYVAQFKQIAAALVDLQGADGLWRAGLLDADAHPMPETSGTSLITYGLAYGVNAGLLDRREFEPHIKSAWRGLVAHIYADGRLGAIQPVSDAPGGFNPTSSYVYGVGAFLMAGSEIYRMCEQTVEHSVDRSRD